MRGDDPVLASYLRIEERELEALGLRQIVQNHSPDGRSLEDPWCSVLKYATYAGPPTGIDGIGTSDGPLLAQAIAQYEGEDDCYIFSIHGDGCIFDNWYESVEDALEAANLTWIDFPSD